MQEKQVILSAKGLCKSFAHNGGQVHILSGMDLDLYAGDFTVVMGASGSGKSTLLYALSGMDRATAGSVTYAGGDLVKMSEKQLTSLRRSDFGFVFQQMHLVSNLSLRENITVPGYLNRKRTAADVDRRADELLELFSLSDHRKKLGSELSKGMAQKLSICLGLFTEPSVLLLDEPFIGLDPHAIKQLKDTMWRLRGDGATLLVSTHIIDSVDMLWDRAIIMQGGEVQSDVMREELQGSERSLEEIFFEVTEGR
jgi:putative ABC transport system ATP-binding protein